MPATAAPGCARTFRRLTLDAAVLTREAIAAIAAIVAFGLAPGYLLSGLALAALGLTDPESIQTAFIEGDQRTAAVFVAVGLINIACRLWALGALWAALAERAAGQTPGAIAAFQRAAGSAFAMVSAGPAVLRLLLSPRREALGRLAAAHLLAAAGYLILSAMVGLFWTFCEALFSGQPSIGEGLLIGLAESFVGGMACAWLIAFAMLLHRELSSAGTRTGPRTASSPRP